MPDRPRTIEQRLDGFATLDLDLDDDGVLRVEMGGPATFNAMAKDTFMDLADMFDSVAVSDSVRVVVLRGSGTRFSTGGNVRGMAERSGSSAGNAAGNSSGPSGEADRNALDSSIRHVARMYRNLLGVDQPIVASVNGDAVGAGATLALHCDIVLASRTARLGDPHVQRGLAASAGPYIWPLMTSLNVAKEYLLTGDLMSADEAYRLGLVNHVYEPAELASATDALARKLALGAPRAVQWTKRLLNRLAYKQYVDLLHEGIAHELLTFGTDDHAEGVNSFLERRPPSFRGR